MSRHLALAATACLALIGAVCPAFAQEARFRLSLAWTVPEIAPEQRTRLASRTLTVILGKGGAVREEVNRNRGGRGRVREGALGDDLDARARWKVLNENTLLRLVAERSHTFAIWLRTDGTRSCSVTLEWRLKSGFTAYEGWARRRDIPIRYSQPKVEQATCEVL
ncbi:hypothetical protein WBO78_17450 [Bosea sp. CCNWLW174]|uniref:hypothetical protein n=1 Tax=unclassified Bosea (in: a-proteobacteria) TaxID=2653178 RepID=UPI0030147A5B